MARELGRVVGDVFLPVSSLTICVETVLPLCSHLDLRSRRDDDATG
jgi:hypothetical protein